MPLPQWLTRVNLVVTNRLTMPIAGRLPWFGVLEQVGRRSGVVRRTPLNVFASGEGLWVVALTYGPGVQWLRNIEAAGECRMLIRGRWLRLVEPRRFRDPGRRRVPLPVRWGLATLRVDWFVELREVVGHPGDPRDLRDATGGSTKPVVDVSRAARRSNRARTHPVRRPLSAAGALNAAWNRRSQVGGPRLTQCRPWAALRGSRRGS
jgi:deazaflavin-dependent oxidoreductase (nitroreductase family)